MTTRNQTYDVLLRNGRVIDPANSVDGGFTIGIKDGRIAFVGEAEEDVTAAETIDAGGNLILPGLVDIHTHVFPEVTSLGIDADTYCRSAGVTTVVDTGSAGAGNWPGFQRVVENTLPQVYGFLNISVPGLCVVSSWLPRWNRAPLQLLSSPAAVEMGRRYPDHIVGIKVFCSGQYTDNGMAALGIAMDAARLLGKPVMVHIDFPPPNVGEILDQLRPGDILTHSFRGGPNGIVSPTGNVSQHALRARERGVLFDIGHGVGSLEFSTAQLLLDQGFLPDTISSDVHSGCINGPAFDLPTTMSKFLSLGMPIKEVIEASTIVPSRAIGKSSEIGHLSVGAKGDISVMRLEEGSFEYFDGVRTSFASNEGVAQNSLLGRFRLTPLLTLKDGGVL